MALKIKPTTHEQRKQIFLQTLLNKTSKVTKVSDNSVLGAIADGVAKVSGKAEKDIVLAVTQLFPDQAYGDQLDAIAANWGIAARFGALGSSTYLRLVGNEGTTYQAAVHTFISTTGIQFVLEEDVAIGETGYAYAKVRSIGIGEETNVPALTIDAVSPTPVGHSYVVNEYAAVGGRDEEDDEIFRIRIKEGPNLLATGTLARLEQVMNKLEPNVLQIRHQGINNNGNVVLAIVTQNGAALTQAELDDILLRGDEFFALTELKPYGTQSYGVELRNIDWQPIDISFRVQLFNDADADAVRDNIQRQMTQYFDFRFWESGDTIEWDDLLQIVKGTRGVKYVPDQFFVPGTDIASDIDKLPRIRGFRMLDLNGSVIRDTAGVLLPVYYPAEADFNYQQTVLSSI